MTRLESTLREISQALLEAGRKWALVGGLAVSVRAEPRFTRDMDLALLAATDREAESICSMLLARGYRLLATVEQEAVGRLATARLLPHGESEEGLVLDLLFASSGIEPELVSIADDLEILPGFFAPVAKTGHLIALKLLAKSDIRPQDQADLISLLAKADPEEIERARAAVALIHERGFHRGKDLASELEEALHKHF